MKQQHNILGRIFLSALLAVPGIGIAGNIPQYKVSKGESVYSELTGGTVIPCSFTEGTYGLFPDGSIARNPKTGEGFPIGFDFRFGGTTVSSFVPSNVGDIYLGDGTVDYGMKRFYVHASPIMHGLKAGEISYATTGDEGGRVLTIQWRNAVLANGSGYAGKYCIQFRLHECDGRIEIALRETETPSSSNGFYTGIHGWNTRDAVILTAEGLDKELAVSPSYTFDVLTPTTYITWDGDDYDHYYTPVYVFTPEGDATPPGEAPGDLRVTQEGDRLRISCTRGGDSAATVILVSEAPLGAGDLPEDGKTFNAGASTRIGNATALYYDNDGHPEATLSGVGAGKTYHVMALGASGYPSYGRGNAAEATYTTPQGAPESLEVTATGASSITLGCVSGYDVIIAATTEGEPGFEAGYHGVFGTPRADAKAGDALEGGGTVVYAGEPGEVTLVAEPNTLTFYRAWTVHEGTVSPTSTDAAGVASPTFPYEPRAEYYPLGERLLGWEHSHGDEFVPVDRQYAGDRALLAASIDHTEVSLTTPPLSSDRDMTLTLEFAMETEKDAAEGGEGQTLMQGYEPGIFGDGDWLRIICGGEILREITEYGGTMTETGLGGNEDGSSTFETIEVPIPAGGEPCGVTIAFSALKKSRLFLRGIRIEQTGEPPVVEEPLPVDAPETLSAEAGEGDDGVILTVTATRGGDAHGTLLLLSEGDLEGAPEDGTVYNAGDKVGNATVVYFGTDAEIEATTDAVGYATEYVVTGISYNSGLSFGEATSTVRVLTPEEPVVEEPLPGDAPEALSAEAGEGDDGVTLTVRATRGGDAHGTLLLLSEGDLEGVPEDGTVYNAGDKVGNATVVYFGTDAVIEATAGPAEYDREYVVTGFSHNEEGRFGTAYSTGRFATSGIGMIGADLGEAVIYNSAGMRLQVSDPRRLPAGIYIINGKKVIKSANN